MVACRIRETKLPKKLDLKMSIVGLLCTSTKNDKNASSQCVFFLQAKVNPKLYQIFSGIVGDAFVIFRRYLQFILPLVSWCSKGSTRSSDWKIYNSHFWSLTTRRFSWWFGSYGALRNRIAAAGISCRGLVVCDWVIFILFRVGDGDLFKSKSKGVTWFNISLDPYCAFLQLNL